jgi:hypothetical protein
MSFWQAKHAPKFGAEFRRWGSPPEWHFQKGHPFE